MGHVYVQGNRAKPWWLLSPSPTPPFKIQASYFYNMLRGNSFLVYGKAIKCQILDSSQSSNLLKNIGKRVTYVR